MDDPADLGARLKGLLPLIGERSAGADEARRPDPEVIRALAEAGLLRLLVPGDYGGFEVDGSTFLRLVTTAAEVCGSTAWVMMTCNEEAGIACSYLDPAPMTELFTSHPATIVAGSGVPKGQARRVDGGWRVTGRWDFVSGSTASDRIVLSNLVADTKPAQFCYVLIPTDELTIEDTWHTHGLRGTGSHDVVLDEHFVPDRWAGVIEIAGAARPDAAYYRLPSGLRFPFPKVGVAAGIASAAIADYSDLAMGKRPLFNKGTLRERPSAQLARGEAEAMVSSALGWVHELVDELWDRAATGGIADDLHARARLGCSYAVAQSISAIERLAAEAGSTANFTSSPLTRRLIDARAVAGHFTVAPYQMTTAGRVLLGLDFEDPRF